MKTVSGAQLTKFGIGTMRIKDHHGIQHGLKHFNVIDTASHFRQELIPKAIRDREAVFLISKAGFKRKDHGFESDISVGFLKQELERSLLELKSDYIDCFMLNHPERLMPVHGTRTFDLIQEGLLFFEEMVQNGVLRSYGIASNTIGAPRSPDYLSLSKILEHAPPNFKAVEFPLNVFEMDCFEQGFDGSPSLMDLLQHNQIYPFTQRPLTCVIPQGVRQLVETQVDPEIDTKILESFERVTDLELEIVARGTRINDSVCRRECISCQVCV
ncbi:NADP-dependent oxidoreductase domain-containing protein [Gorgonomyces haynaldii]|nr:NADP-dependent oxidoreductase domain-containing protein [Gorgonomyces haynaldii]